MTSAEAVSYGQWKKDVDPHDYAAASSFLSIRFGESKAQEVSENLQKLQLVTRRANDILRAAGSWRDSYCELSGRVART